jgi:hypothetical protein
MKKNFGEDVRSIGVDPITGEYYIVIPEWMINEISWYEETEVEVALDGNEIVLREHKNE